MLSVSKDWLKKKTPIHTSAAISTLLLSIYITGTTWNYIANAGTIVEYGVGLIITIPFYGVAIAAPWWLSKTQITESRYYRMGKWYIAGGGMFTALNLLIMVIAPAESLYQYFVWVLWAIGIGSGVGVIIGLFEAQAIERALTAERQQVRKEEAQEQEELLSYLNATLRHEVLNTATIVLGNADMLQTLYEDNDEITDRTETIISNVRDMETVIEDVRTLLKATQGTTINSEVNVIKLLTNELNDINENTDNINIETDFPTNTVFVTGNKGLQRVFRNMFKNSIEHNELPTTIKCDVTIEQETVIITISDTGSGIPENEKDTLFEPDITKSPNNRLGLPLAKTLINSYGGSIELTENDCCGAEFKIELSKQSENSDNYNTRELVDSNGTMMNTDTDVEVDNQANLGAVQNTTKAVNQND